MNRTEIFDPPHIPDQSSLRDYQSEIRFFDGQIARYEYMNIWTKSAMESL